MEPMREYERPLPEGITPILHNSQVRPDGTPVPLWTIKWLNAKMLREFREEEKTKREDKRSKLPKSPPPWNYEFRSVIDKLPPTEEEWLDSMTDEQAKEYFDKHEARYLITLKSDLRGALRERRSNELSDYVKAVFPLRENHHTTESSQPKRTPGTIFEDIVPRLFIGPHEEILPGRLQSRTAKWHVFPKLEYVEKEKGNDFLGFLSPAEMLEWGFST